MMNIYYPASYLKPIALSLGMIFIFGHLFAQKRNVQNPILHYDEENKRIPFSLSQNEAIITLCGLEKETEYTVLVSALLKQNCSFQIELYDENDEDVVINNGEINISEQVVFTATLSCMHFQISNANCFDQTNFALDLSVWPTFCKPLGADSAEKMVAALSTDYDYSIEELITDIFIGGGCFDVSNVQLIGNTNGAGHFTNGATNVMFDEGVILANGNIANAEGPNTSSGAGNGFGDSSGDPDLNLLGAGTVHDAVGIEFDFTPTLSVINFDYVFGSEEYCEYVNSQFNDVFGFFLLVALV